MNVLVEKLTNVSLLRKAAGYTTGRDCKMSLATAYRNGHSIIRTQSFTVELTDIPLFVASQLVRQTQGVQWYQRSKRTDRDGDNFWAECYDFGQRLDCLNERQLIAKTLCTITMVIASLLCDSCISTHSQTTKESIRYEQKSYRVPQAHKDLHEHMLKHQIPNIIRK